MNVVEYLKGYLTENPLAEADVPGLGVFYSVEAAGRRSILFKEELPKGKAFLNYIVFKENLSFEEVKAEVEQWVRGISQALKTQGRAELVGVGVFSILEAENRVVFEPVSDVAASADENFGLETPEEKNTDEPEIAVEPKTEEEPDEEPEPVPAPEQPAQPVRPVRPAQPAQPVQPVRNPGREQQGPRQPQRPRQGNNRAQGQKPRQEANPAKNGARPVNRNGNRPGGSDRENMFAHNHPGARPAAEAAPFYTRWWFILICVLAVLTALAFAITPVREKILGTKITEPVEMNRPDAEDDGILEENVEIFGEDEPEATPDVKPEAKPEAKPEVKPEAKPEPKPETKPAPAPKSLAEGRASTKPETKPEAKPAAKPETKPEPKPAPKEDINVPSPQAGKFYLIVGSFGVQENAKRKADELKAEGLKPTLLFIKEKGLYYVSLKTCADRESALAARSDIRDNRKMECWIYAAN